MQGGPKPGFLRGQVAYYVVGMDEWKYARCLEALTARYDSFYLDSTGNANSISSPGVLSTHQGLGPPDAYTYDPRNTNGPEVAAEAVVPMGAITDQTVTTALDQRQLIYQSMPFEADIEISGFFKLTAWISIDTLDTDIYATVFEIGGGVTTKLSTDCIRARYRESPRSPKVISSQEPLRYHFDNFTFISRLIKKGHLLRLIIAPIGRLTDSTFFEKNYNGGGIVSDESVQDAKSVTLKLFHDANYVSVLQIPCGTPGPIPSNDKIREGTPLP